MGTFARSKGRGAGSGAIIFQLLAVGQTGPRREVLLLGPKSIPEEKVA
jgi:hypothetical protein